MLTMTNGTQVKEFILLGLTDNRNLQILFFLLLFSSFLLTVMGNLLIIVITLVDHHLYTPMYFFLRHLAYMDIGLTTSIIPKALANMAMGSKIISVRGCFIQTYVLLSLGTTEFFLLAVMSVDRYVAICYPLRYSMVMNDEICSVLVICCWLAGFLLILGQGAALFQMPFCGPNIINHFSCDSGPLLKLVCADTSLLQLISFLSAIFCLIGTLMINVVSYVYIISRILRIPSTAGKQNAFSTCFSHFTVILFAYGSCMFMYVRPKSTTKEDFKKSVATFNVIMSPLLIPFLYCLRNKQVKEALIATFRRRQNARGHQCEN